MVKLELALLRARKGVGSVVDAQGAVGAALLLLTTRVEPHKVGGIPPSLDRVVAVLQKDVCTVIMRVAKALVDKNVTQLTGAQLGLADIVHSRVADLPGIQKRAEEVHKRGVLHLAVDKAPSAEAEAGAVWALAARLRGACYANSGGVISAVTLQAQIRRAADERKLVAASALPVMRAAS